MTDPVQPAQTQFEAYTPAFEQQPATPTPAPAPAPAPKKTGVVVFAVIAVLLLGAAGTFGALYFGAKGDASNLSKQVEEKNREIATLTKDVKAGKDEAAKAVDAQKKAEATAASAEKCRASAKALMEAALAQDDAKGEKAMTEIFTTC